MSGPRTIIMPERCTCPKCWAIIEMATSVTPDTTPKSGDWSLCIKCGAVLRFVGRVLRLRAATAAELRQVRRQAPDTWARLIAGQRAIRWRRDRA